MSTNTIHTTSKIPEGIPIRMRKTIDSITSVLQTSTYVNGIMLGGSVSRNTQSNKSDIDLFCLVTSSESFEAGLMELFSNFDKKTVIVPQGYYPWTENLYTVYFSDHKEFAVDISSVDSRKADSFFWEPNGIILIDKLGIIKKYQSFVSTALNQTSQPFLKSNPLAMAVVTLKKIDKNIERKHLWNALECLNMLRRYIMQIIRWYINKDFTFLGRPDRDIEEYISASINLKLTQSVAQYCPRSIARSTLILIDILKELIPHCNYNEESIIPWVHEQITIEQNMLNVYLDAQTNL